MNQANAYLATAPGEVSSPSSPASFSSRPAMTSASRFRRFFSQDPSSTVVLAAFHPTPSMPRLCFPPSYPSLRRTLGPRLPASSLPRGLLIKKRYGCPSKVPASLAIGPSRPFIALVRTPSSSACLHSQSLAPIALALFTVPSLPNPQSPSYSSNTTRWPWPLFLI